MTGANVKIEVTDELILTALRRLEESDRTLLPGVLGLIGQYGVESTQERIRRGVTPTGAPFAPLNPVYEAFKRGPGILRERGPLSDTLAYQVFGSEAVEWGSNLIYAAIHQGGGTIKAKDGGSLAFQLGEALVRTKSVTIPARPYLGVSSADQGEMVAIAEDAYADHLGIESP